MITNKVAMLKKCLIQTYICCSTLSTYLNSLSGIIYTDFIYPLLPKDMAERRDTTFMMIITVVIGLLSVALIFVVERLGTILQLMSTLHGITFGPLLGVVTMGMVFPFANKRVCQRTE